MKLAWIGVAVVAAGVAVGCSSKMERAESRSVTSAESFRDELKEMPDRIGKTINTLYETTASTAADRNASFAEFRRQLQWLQNDANSVASAAERARGDREKFFREWNKAAMRADPSKREDMNATAAAREINYNTATSYLDGARDSYRALVSQLNDVSAKLGMNLNNYANPDVKSAVSNALVKATDLKDYVSRLTEQVDAALAGAGR